MKVALAVAVVLLAIPASAKTWVDEVCEISLVSQNDVFTFGKVDGSQNKDCAISAWPVNTKTAQLSCKDGSTSKLTLIDDTAVIFDGVRLNAYDGKLSCGQDGAEWPD